MKLRPFEGDHAPTILGWASNDTELGNWASLTARPSSSVFTDWHADADVHAYVLHDDDVPIAYGDRITSYNVCYTKLLRPELLGLKKGTLETTGR